MIDERDTDVYDRYRKDALEYEGAALGVFQESYSKDRQKSYKAGLKIQAYFWGVKNSTVGAFLYLKASKIVQNCAKKGHRRKTGF